MELTAKAGGSFVKVDAGGVTISGAEVKVNTGGAPGVGTGIGILEPVIPWAAAKDKAGALLVPAAAQLALAKAARAAGDIRCPICEACREGKCDLGATA